VGAVHLVGGSLGALLIGFLGTSDTGGANGLLYGGGTRLLQEQMLAVGSVVAYSFFATLVLASTINVFKRIRLSPEQEREGMDTVLHGESAYEF
jgi:Amt family ammonium transporter